MSTKKTTPMKQTRSEAPRRSRPPKTNSGRPQDAIAMLRDDHKRVSEMFERFGNARGSQSKAKLAQQICQELEVHAQLEEELFYPPVREAIGEDDLMDEAEVEHASAKELIAQIKAMSPEDDLFDAKVTVLGEYIRHHVKEEQNEMFPKVRDSELDLAELGGQMRVRKEEILGGTTRKLRRMVS